MRANAIRLKLLIPGVLALLTLCILSAVMWAQLRTARTQAMEHVRQELSASGAAIQRETRRLFRLGETDAVSGCITWTGTHPLSAGSVIVGANDRVIAGTRMEWIGRPAATALPPHLIPAPVEFRSFASVLPYRDSEIIVGTFPLNLDSTGLGISEGKLVLALDARRPIAVARAAAWRTFRVLSLSMLALTGLLGIALNALISRRVNALLGAVDRISTGEYSTFVPVDGHDELGELAAGIDGLCRRLSAQAIEREGVQNRLLLQQRAMEKILQVTSDLLYDLPLAGLAAKVFERISSHLDCDHFAHFVAAGDRLRLLAYEGLDNAIQREFAEESFGRELYAELAARDAEVLDLASVSRPLASVERRLGTRAALCYPLFAGDQLLGALLLTSRREHFNEFDRQLIRAAAQAIAAAMIRTRDADELRSRESKYRRMVETTLDGFWILDRDGRLLDLNEVYAARSGYAREELIGTSAAMLEAEESPAELAAHMETIVRLVMTGSNAATAPGTDPSGQSKSPRSPGRRLGKSFRFFATSPNDGAWRLKSAKVAINF